MSTITVSAGRNVGDTPMDDGRWAMFCEDITLGVNLSGHQVLFVGTGDGIWEDTVEEAFTIVALTTESSDTDALTRWLADLAPQYRQDAIAITTGETVLAGLKVEA